MNREQCQVDCCWLPRLTLGAILEHISAVKPALVIVDSIQTTYMPELEFSAGSVTQVRECASRLRELAKSSGMAIFLIGHVTKEGAIAGPRVLEHIVDTVLYLEGDRFQTYRLLRSVKNRFGATSEVGVFEMRERGMVEVTNPSEAFLAERMVNAPGSAIAVTMEGTRPILVEVQGLSSPTAFGNPRRTPNGIDFNRLLLVTAVLARRIGLRLGDQDVFINVVGGIQVEEPAADLAVAAAIASSMRDVPLKADTVLIGEVGLSGELRMVGQMPARLREAARLGFKTAIVPKRLRKTEPWPSGIEVVEARSLREALEKAILKKRIAIDKNGLCSTKMMSILDTDTHPQMETLHIRLLRQASPAQKMEMLSGLNASATMLALIGLRSQYPSSSETELQRRLAGLLLGEKLACKAYGDLDDVA